MISYADSLNLNATKARSNPATGTTNAHDVARYQGDQIHWCSKCNSLTNALNKNNSKWKRSFSSGVDLILHEQKCVEELRKILGYYNEHEISSFQVELNIP